MILFEIPNTWISKKCGILEVVLKSAFKIILIW